MAEQTISYMNHRGVVTIDHEIRDVLGVKNKRALMKLSEIEVLEIDGVSSPDVPNKKGQTISRMDKRGCVVIDQEIRQVLGIDDKKAMLRIGEIDVEWVEKPKESDEIAHESLAGGIISLWVRYRLRLEHFSAAESDQWDHYPPSPKRGAAIAVGTVVWAASFGVFWGLNGVLALNPITGDVTVTPGIVIGLIIGVFICIANLPSFERVEPESTVGEINPSQSQNRSN